MIKLTLNTNYKSEVIDVTNEIKEEVIKSGVREGIVTIFVPHSTASVVLFENSDKSLKRELLDMLKKVIPEKNFSHDNAIAHLKAAFLRNNINLIVENGKIVLGKWQGIYFVEFDGPREREIYLKVING
jgi:secondary thiamine-phosphate synthase enzyme